MKANYGEKTPKGMEKGLKKKKVFILFFIYFFKGFPSDLI
jgi:hypothetical protein